MLKGLVVSVLLGLREIFVFSHVKSDREYRVIREKLITGMRQKRLPQNIFLCSTRRRKGKEGGAGKEGEKQGNKRGEEGEEDEKEEENIIIFFYYDDDEQEESNKTRSAGLRYVTIGRILSR